MTPAEVIASSACCSHQLNGGVMLHTYDKHGNKEQRTQSLSMTESQVQQQGGQEESLICQCNMCTICLGSTRGQDFDGLENVHLETAAFTVASVSSRTDSSSAYASSAASLNSAA